MSEKSFSQINTAISVRESTFLTASQYEQLLQAKDSAGRAQVLQGTVYAMEADAVRDLNALEQVLMQHLFDVYSWALANSPDPAVVEIFSLKYSYHNLKVFLKEKATGRSLKQLVLPVGTYPPEVLEHLVATFSAEHCPDFMLDQVLATWQEYQDYQDLRVLEIGMDLAYFRHLTRLSQTLDHETLVGLLGLMIDFYNAITVKRATDLDKPRSFMRQLLSDEGSLTAADWIEMAEQTGFLVWFHQVNPQGYDLDLRPYEDRMRDQTITAVELEYLADLIQTKVLDQARFETDGPLPLARYLLGKELEIKNLRLVLTGLDNQLPLEKIKEKMRPIYGQ